MKMLGIIKRTLVRGSEERDGMTLSETMAVVGAMAVFASIYTYIVVRAVTSSP